MNRADRYSTGAKFGPLRFTAYRSDGQPMMSSAYVRDPTATECWFVMWSLAGYGANDDHFFGPIEAA